MDIYDLTRWTEMDSHDLKAAVKSGHSLEEIAAFLCRSGSIHEVRSKCRELGLKPSAEW